MLFYSLYVGCCRAILMILAAVIVVRVSRTRARNWPAVVNGLAYRNTMNHLSSVTVGRHFRQSTSVAKVTRQQSNNIEQKREYCLLLSIFSRCVIIVVK